MRRQKELVCFLLYDLQSYVIYIWSFFCSLSQSLPDRLVQGLVILEKLFLEIRHSWMGMYPLWKVLQQIQKENGRTFIRKQKVRPKKMLISQLLNIAEWSYSCRSGKYLNLHLIYVILQILLSFSSCYLVNSTLIWICWPFSTNSCFSFTLFHFKYICFYFFRKQLCLAFLSSVSTSETTVKRWQSTHELAKDMCNQHVSTMHSVVRWTFDVTWYFILPEESR